MCRVDTRCIDGHRCRVLSGAPSPVGRGGVVGSAARVILGPAWHGQVHRWVIVISGTTRPTTSARITVDVVVAHRVVNLWMFVVDYDG